MQCHVNHIVINEVPKFMALTPSETMNAIQIINPLNHYAIMAYKSFCIFKKELMVEAHCGILPLLRSANKGKVCSTTGDGLLSLLIQ